MVYELNRAERIQVVNKLCLGVFLQPTITKKKPCNITKSKHIFIDILCFIRIRMHRCFK